MLSPDPKNKRKREQRRAEREQQQKQNLAIWKKPLNPPSTQHQPSLDRIVAAAIQQFEHFYPIAQQTIPNLPNKDECEAYFVGMVRAHYQALVNQRMLPVLEPSSKNKAPPLYLPANWRETLKHPEPHGRVRGSSMVVKLGMCGIRGFLEDVFRSDPKLKDDYRPNRAMQKGKRAHEEMHKEEKEAVYSLHTKTDCRLLLKLEYLCDPHPGLLYLEEKELASEIDYQGVKIPVTGTPDRMVSAGGNSPIFILEGKTNLFESNLVMGYVAQMLIYGKIVYDHLRAHNPEMAKQRKIYTLLTESLDPLTENDLAPLAEGHPEGFLKKMLRYAKRKEKVLVVQEYGFMQRAFVHGLIHTSIEARENPYLLQGPSSPDICNRCPWSERDCDTYKKIKQAQSL